MKSDWAETKAMELHGTGEKFRRNVHINATAQALREAEARGMERAAKMVIEATRIPDDAIARGTGVRDHVVLLGEKLADSIRYAAKVDKV